MRRGQVIAAYSQDLRDRVLQRLERGEGVPSIAYHLDVSERWVYHVKNRYERNGERCAQKLGGYRRSRVADWESRIRVWLKERVDLTLVELSERLARHGVVIKTTALWHQLDKWGLTLKKNVARQRARARGRTSRTKRMAKKASDARRH